MVEAIVPYAAWYDLKAAHENSFSKPKIIAAPICYIYHILGSVIPAPSHSLH